MAGAEKYGGYRGRKPLGKIFLAVLLILVIAAAAVFLGLQRYMYYDAEGNLRLELPDWGIGSGKPGEDLPDSPEDLNIIIDRKDPAQEAEKKPETEMPEEPVVVFRGAVQLADMPLTDWAAASAQMSAAEVSAVCVTVKDDEGYVYVDSLSADALSRRIVTAKNTTEKAVMDLTEDPAVETVIARISCLKDSRTPILDVRALGLRQKSGYLFYDDTGASWLDPAKERVISYLTGLARECAEMGFDEILLTNVAYPASGEIEKINHGEKTKSENLAAFIGTVRDALSGYDVKLSLELPAEAVTAGSVEATGQSLQELAPLVDCIYVRTAAAEVLQLAELVKLASPDTGFVAEVTDADGIAADWLLYEE